MTKLSNTTKNELTRLVNDIAMCEATYARRLAEDKPYKDWHNWVIYGYQARLDLFDKFGIDTISCDDKKGFVFTIQDARDRVRKYWDEQREELEQKVA